jgi:hypothetical protein
MRRGHAGAYALRTRGFLIVADLICTHRRCVLIRLQSCQKLDFVRRCARDGLSMHPSFIASCSDPSLPARQVDTGDLALGAELHRSSLGAVVLASRQSDPDGSPLAVRRLHRGMEADGEARSMLAREVAIGARLASPHTVRVFAETADSAGISVMEHVEGLSLAELISRGQSRPDLGRLLVPVVVDALLGLSAVHKFEGASGSGPGVVHQAPVPRHVLVGLDGVGRLGDFTQCVGAGFPWSQRLVDRLRPHELAPEHALAPAHVDSRCDVFIAATMLWHALTGRALFGDASAEEAVQRMLRMPIPSLREAGVQAGTGINRLLFRALARARAERLATAAEFAEELRSTAKSVGLYADREEVAALVKALREARMLPSALSADARKARALPAPRPVSTEIQRTLIGYAAHPGAGREQAREESGVRTDSDAEPTGIAARQAQVADFDLDDETTFRLHAQQAAAEVAGVVAQLGHAPREPEFADFADQDLWADPPPAKGEAEAFVWASIPPVPVAEPFPVRYPVATADGPADRPGRDSRLISVDAADSEDFAYGGRRSARRGGFGRFVRLVGTTAVAVVGSGLLLRAMLPAEDRAAARELGAILGDRAASLVQELGPLQASLPDSLRAAQELVQAGDEPSVPNSDQPVQVDSEPASNAAENTTSAGAELGAPSRRPAVPEAEPEQLAAEPEPTPFAAPQDPAALPPGGDPHVPTPAMPAPPRPQVQVSGERSEAPTGGAQDSEAAHAAAENELLPFNPY